MGDRRTIRIREKASDSSRHLLAAYSSCRSGHRCSTSYFRPVALPVAAPILVLWFFSRQLPSGLIVPVRPARSALKDKDEAYARRVALKTWRFFREFSNEEHNWLIPDNIQGEEEAPAARISTRTWECYST